MSSKHLLHDKAVRVKEISMKVPGASIKSSKHIKKFKHRQTSCFQWQ